MASKCRKFVPNIFNKTKCQNCFGAKESHSAEALENNKASRKVSKCGYLFVSPGFDFNNPLDRTRRWQRRFFVLYDDAELTWSVDDNAETVPQGTVDMNKCTDVQDAEKVTGHVNSISVVTPEKTIYIKGESKEESQWWQDVLIEFPRSMNTILKPRRKSTLSLISNKENVQPDDKKDDDKGIIKGRFEIEKVKGKSDVPAFSTFKGVRSLKHKYDKNYQEGLRKSSSLHDLSSEDKNQGGDLVSSRFLSRSGDRLDYVSKGDRLYGRQKILSDSKYMTNPYFTLPRINTSPALLMPKPYPGTTSTPVSSTTNSSIRRSSFDDRPGRSKNLSAAERARQHRERSTSLKDFPTQLSLPRDGGSSDSILSQLDDATSESMSTDETESNETDELKMARSSELSAATRAHSLSSNPVSPDPPKGTKYEDLVYMKKGWLLKQGPLDKDTKKHWFVLAGNSLRYYRDAKAEDLNSLDGRIDLSTCYEVSEVNTARNYGFKIKTRNGEYNLAAMTSGIRNNWMKALRLCMDLHSSGRTSGMASTPHSTKSLSGVGARTVDDFDVSAKSSQTKSVKGSTGETAFQLVGRREPNKKDMKNTRRHHSDVNPGNVSKAFSVKEFSSPLDQVPSTQSSSSQSVSSDRSSQSMDYEHSNTEGKGSPRLSRGTKIPRHHIPSQDLTWQSSSNPPLKRYVEGSDNAPKAPAGDTARVTKRSIMSESSKEEEQREKLRRGMSPSARVKEKTRPAKTARMHSPPPSDDTYHFNLSSSSKETYSGDSDNDEVDIGDRSLSQDQFHDEQMRSEEDDNMMGGASPGSIGDGGVLVEILETEVETLKDRLEKSENDLAKMHETNRDLKSRLQTSASGQSHHMDGSYISGGRWGQQSSSQYDATQVQGMKKQMKDAKDTVQKQKIEIDNLKGKLDMSVSKLTGTEKALSEALKNLKQEKDRFVKLTSEWNRRIRTLETELKDKSLKLERSRESLLSKERECQHLESDIKSHQHKARDQEREILRMKAVEAEYKQLKDRLESKEKELLAMQKLLKEKEAECKKVAGSYERQIEEMERDYSHERDDLENHLEQMKAQLCQAHERQTTMKDSITSNISDLMREKNEIISQLEEKLIENERKMEDMNENFQAMMAENTELVSSVESLQEEKRKLQDKLKEMETYLSGLHNKITHYEPDNASLRKHMDELRKENELLSEKLSSEKKSYSQHQRENKELQKTIQDLNKQIQGLQLRLIERFEDIDQAHRSSSSSGGDNQELLHSVLIMDSELKEVNTMLLELRQNFDAYLDSIQGESRSKFTALADMIEDIGRKCHSVQEILKESVDPSLLESVGSDYKHEIKVDTSSKSQAIMDEYRTLKNKFDRAVAELKKLRKEVNVVYSSYDELQSDDRKLREKVKLMEENYKSQLEQMIKKVDTLSSKVQSSKSGSVSVSSSRENVPTELSQNIEQQLNKLEQKLLLVEKSLSDNESKSSADASRTQISSRLSLSTGDSQSIVLKLKEMKTQLENSNSQLTSIAKSINSSTDKMDTSDSAVTESLQSRIEVYGKKIDSLATKVEQGSQHVSGNPHGVGGIHDGAAMDECFREIKEKLQEINEQLDGLEEDSDSDDEDQEQVTVEDVRERVATLMSYLEQHSNMSRADWNILGMLQRQLTSSNKPSASTNELSMEDRLQLYGDRLAMESVILQEMSVLLTDEYSGENREAILKEIDSQNCQILLLQQLLESETQSMHMERKQDVLTSYASLLAEKIVLEDQLVSSSTEELMEEDTSLSLSRPRVLAKEALLRSQLDAHINNNLEKSLNSLEPVSSHVITKSVIQGELTYALNTIKEKLLSFESVGGSDICKKRRDFLYRQLKAREKVVLDLVEEYQGQMVKSLAVIIAKEGEEVTVFEGAESVLEDVCSEISTVMEKHIQSHKERVRYAEDTETAHKHDLVVDTLRADREKVLTAIKVEHANYASQEEPKNDDLDLPFHSVDTTIEHFGQIMSQNAIIKATAVFLGEMYPAEDYSLDVDSSDSESEDSEAEVDKSLNVFLKNLSDILLKEAASKSTMSAQLDSGGDSAKKSTNIVARIPDLSKYPPRLSKYADSIVKEAVFQAQLTYTVHKAKLQHENEIAELKHDFPYRKADIMHEGSRDSEIDFHQVLMPLEEVLENKYEDECSVLTVMQKQLLLLKDVVKDSKARNWSQVEEQLRQLEETFQTEMTSAQERHDIQMEVFKQELVKVEKVWDERESEREGFEGQCGELHDYLESMKANHDEEVERMKQDVMTAVGAIRANEESQMIAQVQKLKEHLATQTDTFKTFLEDVKKESTKTSLPDLARKVEQQLSHLHTTVTAFELENVPVTPKTSVSEAVEGAELLSSLTSPGAEALKGEKVMDLSQHESELEQLKRDKEEALAEEMRNTKAALDAMRKAYEEELGEEKEKYREALMTMYTDDYVSEFKHRHELEMEKMREELGQTQMHYQSKCEDYKLLELKLQQTKQEYENHYTQLIHSNDHLNMMLNQEIDGLKEFIRNKPSSSTTGGGTIEEELFDSQIMIRVKDAELQKLRSQVKNFENSLQRSTEEHRQAMTQYLQVLKENTELKAQVKKDKEEEVAESSSKRPIRRTPSFHARARSPSPQPTSSSKKEAEHSSRDSHRRRRIGPQDLRRSKSSPSLPYVFDAKNLPMRPKDPSKSAGKTTGKETGRSPRSVKGGRN